MTGGAELGEVLRRIDGADAFGSGAQPSDAAADDRSGRFWLVTDANLRMAVKVAVITGRPLLVEGPPGSGKSSLARAVAETLGWDYYEQVITSQTRLDELIGYVDVVRRLHRAELASRLGEEFGAGLEEFIVPGVLWRAFDPGDKPGAVVLMDEIDKAEPDLPNNLLVPLGSLELRVEGRDEPVRVTRPVHPLVVITSNGERELPPAFLRRCVAFKLQLPDPAQLVEIARGHVATDPALIEAVRQRFVPGTENHEMTPAEFVDAVRAAHGLGLDPNGDAVRWEQVQQLLRPLRPR